jgi:hypothetical protein
MAKKKKISPTERKLRNQVYYLNSRKKKIDKEIESLSHLKETTKKVFGKNKDGEPQKRMVKTIRNKLINQQIYYNTKFEKTIKTLDKRFKYKYQKLKEKEKNKIGLIPSPLFSAFESKDAKNWVNSFVDKQLFFYSYNEIDKCVKNMTSKDNFQITYNRGLLNDLRDAEENEFNYLKDLINVFITSN